MTKGDALRDRTAALIIDRAATLLARGKEASMEDIAAAAGVGRATLYRYFANREDLLRAMAVASVKELAAQISDAHLDAAPFDEAITRLTRAIITTGTKYLALSRDGGSLTRAHPDADSALIRPVRALFDRGIAEGSLRNGLSPDLLMSLYAGLVRGALATSGGNERTGIEDTVAAIVSVFLDGVRTQDARAESVKRRSIRRGP